LAVYWLFIFYFLFIFFPFYYPNSLNGWQITETVNVDWTCAENGLFGVSLDVLLEHDQKKLPQLQVPLILKAVRKCQFAMYLLCLYL